MNAIFIVNLPSRLREGPEEGLFRWVVARCRGRTCPPL